MGRLPECLDTKPEVKATFEYHELPTSSPNVAPIVKALECSKYEDLAVYNDLDERFQDYLDANHCKSLRMLFNNEEPGNYNPKSISIASPRLIRLYLAATQKRYLPKNIDVLTNRGDLVDLAVSFFPGKDNNFEKVNHVVYLKSGRLFLWHDRARDDTFSNSRSRKNWYSGHKFEHMCTHTWPDDVKTWGPLPPLDEAAPPTLSLVQLPLSEDMNVLMMAEYDVRLPKRQGLSGFAELKCFQPRMNNRKCDQISWHKLSNSKMLKLLITNTTYMRFFKTLLQSRLSGCENLIYGIRNNKTSLVSVRRFHITQIELRLQQLQPDIYHSYYLKALKNVAEFLKYMYHNCEEGKFYLIQKQNAKSPLSVTSTAREHLTFKNIFTDDFTLLLEKSEKTRREFMHKSRPGLNRSQESKHLDKFEFKPSSPDRKKPATKRSRTRKAKKKEEETLTSSLANLSLKQAEHIKDANFCC